MEDESCPENSGGQLNGRQQHMFTVLLDDFWKTNL